jgi:hypothetical protein
MAQSSTTLAVLVELGNKFNDLSKGGILTQAIDISWSHRKCAKLVLVSLHLS